MSTPILNKSGVSPDGKWVIVLAPGVGEQASAAGLLVPVQGGASKMPGPGCPGLWSPDGAWLYCILPTDSLKTLAIPVRTTGALPVPDSLPAMLDLAAKGTIPPGTRLIEHSQVSPGPDPSTYAFVRQDAQRNLFRIPLR